VRVVRQGLHAAVTNSSRLLTTMCIPASACDQPASTSVTYTMASEDTGAAGGVRQRVPQDAGPRGCCGSRVAVPRLRRDADRGQRDSRPHRSSSSRWAQLAGEPSRAVFDVQSPEGCKSGRSGNGGPEARSGTYVRLTAPTFRLRENILQLAGHGRLPVRFALCAGLTLHVTEREVLQEAAVSRARCRRFAICRAAVSNVRLFHIRGRVLPGIRSRVHHGCVICGLFSGCFPAMLPTLEAWEGGTKCHA
jgi:hypothetical protein